MPVRRGILAVEVAHFMEEDLAPHLEGVLVAVAALVAVALVAAAPVVVGKTNSSYLGFFRL